MLSPDAQGFPKEGNIGLKMMSIDFFYIFKDQDNSFSLMEHQLEHILPESTIMSLAA